jgi:hypothetical protein
MKRVVMNWAVLLAASSLLIAGQLVSAQSSDGPSSLRCDGELSALACLDAVQSEAARPASV